MEQNRRLFSKSGKTGIGEKLRQSLNTFAIDVWGLEKQTAQSITRYFEKVAVEKKVQPEQFSLRISFGESVLIRVYAGRDDDFPIEVWELLRLLNVPVINPSNLEKLVDRIKHFLIAYCEVYQSDNLQLSFKPANEKVLIHLLNNEDILVPIPFQALLTQFSVW